MAAPVPRSLLASARGAIAPEFSGATASAATVTGTGTGAGTPPPDPRVAAADALLQAMAVPKAALAALVAEQLRVDGYLSAAAEVSRETHVAADAAAADDSAGARVAVRDAVMRGDVPSAVALLEHHWPGLLAQRPLLRLRLLQQAAIDIVCGVAPPPAAAKWAAAADIVASHMLPLVGGMEAAAAAAAPCECSAPPAVAAAELVAARDTVEDTSLLLAFPHVVEAALACTTAARPPSPTASAPPPALPLQLAALLRPDHRAATADLCNRASLEAGGHYSVPRLQLLLQWLQRQEDARGTPLGPVALGHLAATGGLPVEAAAGAAGSSSSSSSSSRV